MRADTHQADEAKLVLRRAQKTRWNKNRDYRVLPQLKKAEMALLPPRKLPAARSCLVCSKPFPSKWCGNRMCENCRKLNL